MRIKLLIIYVYRANVLLLHNIFSYAKFTYKTFSHIEINPIIIVTVFFFFEFEIRWESSWKSNLSMKSNRYSIIFKFFFLKIFLFFWDVEMFALYQWWNAYRNVTDQNEVQAKKWIKKVNWMKRLRITAQCKTTHYTEIRAIEMSYLV